jgi:hypothetical protein
MFAEVLEAVFGTGGAAFAGSVQTATMPRAPINFMLVKRIAFLPRKLGFILLDNVAGYAVLAELKTVSVTRLLEGRASIVDGDSPKSALYSPANRPNCQKP